MRLSKLLLITTLSLLSNWIAAQPPSGNISWLDNSCEITQIRIAFSDATELNTCNGDGLSDRIRFTTVRRSMLYSYLVVDENDVIVYIGLSNFIDFENLPVGNLRVFAFSHNGLVTAQVGDNYLTTDLAAFCEGLTTNFISVNNFVPSGGLIATEDGETNILVCPDDGVADVIRFDSTQVTGVNFTYIITDENNEILSIPTGDSQDFEGAPEGVCRVWGLSYTGSVLATVGDTLDNTLLAESCYGLSDNFITVTRQTAEGGSVALESGGTETLICPGDELADVIAFDSSGVTAPTFTYLVTDENNIVLSIPTGDSQDFNGAPVGTCRVWGLGYAGELLVAPGDDAAAIALATGCFDLSDNFITVIREVPDGGTVATEAGETEIYVCPGDDNPDPIAFDSTGTSPNSNYTYVVTDENNVILGVPGGDVQDFNGAGTGVCRVWGLAYTGNLTAAIGDDAAAVALSDDCFDLSDNFITVIRIQPDGGTVATEEGETDLIVCPGDGISDVIRFDSTGVTAENFTYVVTDDQNVILGVPGGDFQDFEGAGVGVCRVWGLAYTGNLTAMVGDDAAAVALSDDCFDLSDNFITVNRVDPDGGTVATTDGDTEVVICPGDGDTDLVFFASMGAVGPNFTYVITDADNNILSIPDGDSNDFDGAPEGVCRVWGLAYAGSLTAAVGDNAAEVALADGCFDLSDNFITVIREVPEGGTVATEAGETEVYVCPGDDNADVLIFAATGTSTNTSYVYVVTDENNVILSLPASNFQNFNNAGVGICRVWGLAYTGNLTAMIGENAAVDALSNDCFDLSDNFITVIRIQPDGGTVATEEGETELTVCPGDGLSDVIRFDSTGVTAENFTYVVTDDQNVILGVPGGDFQDFEGASVGVCRVWGLAYTGNLTAMVGDDAAAVALSDDCFDLSDNFITVTRIQPDGGTVATDAGETEVSLCPGNGLADVINFTSMGAVGPNFTYVITDADNNILGIPSGDSNDFDGAPAGVCRVWGLAYAGNLTAAIGDNAAEVALADGCFDLSDNFITVVREVPEAGTVQTEAGETEVFVCPGDDIADVVSFDSLNTSATAAYQYIVTTADDRVLALPATDELDFNVAPPGVCRVWGVAYTGTLNIVPGDTLTNGQPLSDDCFDLSDNFITVVRDQPVGGSLETESGKEEVKLCPDDALTDVIRFDSSGVSNTDYTYLVTDENNVILSIPTGDAVDFTGAPLGICRVWGLAYTGNLTAQVGDDAGAVALSDDCYELSGNFVTIIRENADGGTIATDAGETEVILCPGDGNADIVNFDITGQSGPQFTYVITDADNNILSLPENDSFDFDGAPEGICRVWGLSYAGDITATAGDNAATVELATGCFDLSDNFITVIREKPNGGTVTTEAGEDTVYTCPGDELADVVRFDSTGTSAFGNYAYVITAIDNRVLLVASGDSLDFNIAPSGTCLVWGLAYTGTLNIIPGDTITSSTLSDDCFNLSANVITVIRDQPDGGTVQTEDGENDVFICPDDGVADVIRFDSLGTSTGLYTYVITDTANVILGLPGGDSLDFDAAGLGICRVWGLAYTGTITATVGDTASVVALSDDCFDLSDNFITVTREDVAGGTVSTPPGNTELVFLCAGDGTASVLTFNSANAQGPNFSYLVTTPEGVVLAVPTDNSFDFENLPDGSCRVYGLAYAGDLTAAVGDTLGVQDLATGCNDLSDNFVLIVKGLPEAGDITTAQGDSLAICSGDTSPDLIEFLVNGASELNYAYLVTQDSFLVGTLGQSSFDFNNTIGGTYQIYGLAYAGSLSIFPGDNIFNAEVATDCYDLTDNFVTIEVTRVDGGTISTTDNLTTLYLCPSDAEANAVSFKANYDAAQSTYVYLLTTTSGIILQVIENGSFDFTGIPLEQGRIYGLSYTDSLLATVGTNITAVLSTGCFDLSANFIPFFREEPDGGTLSVAGTSETDILLCVGTDDPVLTIETTTNSVAAYVLLLTDTNNVVLDILTDFTIDFDQLEPGNYRVHGLSYTGSLVVMVGDDVDELSELATSCFALSSNFISVERAPTLTGGVLSLPDGSDTLIGCPNAGNLDVVVSLTTSMDMPYQYVITDENGTVIIPNVSSNVIPFDGAEPGVYRVYGFAYLGNATLIFGQNIEAVALSDYCYSLSENFITVILETPDGGTVSTETGDTEITVAGDTTFVASNTGTPLLPYYYVLTDTENEVVKQFVTDSIDLSGIDLTGTYRLYGVSHTGEAAVLTTGEAIDTLQLSNDCFDLSDNFIAINPEDGIQSPDAGVLKQPVTVAPDIQLSPNPSLGRFLAQLPVDNLTGGVIRIFSSTGQVEAVIAVAPGQTLIEIDLPQLVNGYHVLRFDSDAYSNTVRFLKQ